jgi:hypothetical protein
VSVTILQKLIKRGDRVAIVNGRLQLDPVSGQEVPADWLKHNYVELVTAILHITNHRGLILTDFSTGFYSSFRQGGVTLFFDEVNSWQPRYSIFNVRLTRVRSTAHGKEGDRLRGKQFRVGRKSNFYIFWVKSRLSVPPRLSSFHDYMGNLKNLVFTSDGQPANDGRIQNEDIHLLSISHSEICAFFEDKTHTTYKQLTANCHTKYPDKQSEAGRSTKGFPRDSTTCDSQCDRSQQDVRDKNALVSLLHQSTEGWLCDYNKGCD